MLWTHGFMSKPFRKTVAKVPPHSLPRSEPGGPAHLAQHLNILDFSNVAKKGVELGRIRLVKTRQQRKQEQRFECESPRFRSLDHLTSVSVSPTTRDKEMYTDRDDSREKIPPQKIGTRAELADTTHEDDGELENFVAKIS
jgi:hypothetical protein